MPARSVGSGMVSFGLVAIPVRFYTATHSEAPSFNLIHKECGSRIKQLIHCPKCERTVERSELVRGYEVTKEQYALFSDDELRALETAASPSIDIQEFVPLAAVDPIYFEGTQYLGPDKGGDKAYQLLVDAMREMGMAAIAQHVSRGKERLVLIRAVEKGLVLHTLYYADEVRSLAEVPMGEAPARREGELKLARQLIDQLAAEGFHPERYRDHYRDRLTEAVERKVAGQETTITAPAPRAQVIDLMEALKESLARERTRATPKPAAGAAREERPLRRVASKKKQ